MPSIDSAASLANLPVELQYQIIHILDPIGLINLHQTNQYFRRLIRPERQEWAEYLLTIEHRERYGGATRIFWLYYNGVVEPKWDEEAWEAHRWACTNCLKLLPHTDFDNSSLLRLPYRKPDPESPAATNTFTSWVPTLHGKTWGRKTRPTARRDHEQDLLHDDEQDYHRLLGNLDMCGYRRWRRRCNECRFQKRDLRPLLSHWGGYMGGTRQVPIQRSRRHMFQSAFDRWFPKIADFLENKPPPFPPRIVRPQRWNVETQPWSMYMVRCPRCECWQEIRSFRFGGCYPNWKPSHDGKGELEFWTSLSGDLSRIQLDELRCNRCFAEEHGREALAQALLAWCKVSLSLHRWDLETRLPMPACQISNMGFKFPGFEKEFKKLLREMNNGKRKMEEYEGYLHSDTALLQLHHYQFIELWEKAKAHNPTLAEEILDSSQYLARWIDRFHEDESHWRWVVACEKELEENPGILVDWALSRGLSDLR